MAKKLWMAGETIDPEKQYPGGRVVRLIEESYENGRRRGDVELEMAKCSIRDSAYGEGYAEGYETGYKDASRQLVQLKDILREILEIDAE